MIAPNPDRDALWHFLEQDRKNKDFAPSPMPSSPLLEGLNAQLCRFDQETQRLEMSFAPPPLFRQGAGFIQGGALSIMLDFVMAFCSMAAVGKEATVTTISLSTDFMAPALGEVIHATGEIEKAGGRLVFAQAWLDDGPKKVAAARSSLLILR